MDPRATAHQLALSARIASTVLLGAAQQSHQLAPSPLAPYPLTLPAPSALPALSSNPAESPQSGHLLEPLALPSVSLASLPTHLQYVLQYSQSAPSVASTVLVPAALQAGNTSALYASAPLQFEAAVVQPASQVRAQFAGAHPSQAKAPLGMGANPRKLERSLQALTPCKTERRSVWALNPRKLERRSVRALTLRKPERRSVWALTLRKPERRSVWAHNSRKPKRRSVWALTLRKPERSTSQALNQSRRWKRRSLSALNSRRQPGRSLERSPPTRTNKTQTRCLGSRVVRASASRPATRSDDLLPTSNFICACARARCTTGGTF